MKIVVAPNAMKDCLTTGQVARAIADGVRRAMPDAAVVCVPVADGGDGLFALCEQVRGGERVPVEVAGPLFEPVRAEYLLLPDSHTAVVEMARASGLALLRPEERSARRTTSFGTGQLVLDALRRGARKILLGIGGSACNDGGIGFMTALGGQFLDASGRAVEPVGESLPAIASIDLSAFAFDPAGVVWEAVCDVDNPLLGARGAAAVFGPQKGADAEDVAFLDAGLAAFAGLTRTLLRRDFSAMPGAGAAGGLGFALAAFCGARLRRGVDVVLDMVELDRHLAGADLALTAEGRLDFQTAFGKGPAGVGLRARAQGVPCLALAGEVHGDLTGLYECGIDGCFAITSGPMVLEDAIRNAPSLLADTAEQVCRAFLAGLSRGREGRRRPWHGASAAG